MVEAATAGHPDWPTTRKRAIVGVVLAGLGAAVSALWTVGIVLVLIAQVAARV